MAEIINLQSKRQKRTYYDELRFQQDKRRLAKKKEKPPTHINCRSVTNSDGEDLWKPALDLDSLPPLSLENVKEQLRRLAKIKGKQAVIDLLGDYGLTPLTIDKLPKEYWALVISDADIISDVDDEE